MRKTLLLVAPLVASVAFLACSGREGRRSGFTAEDPNEPEFGDGGFGTEVADASKGSCSGEDNGTTVTRTPLVILFVVDESTSMNSANKWVAARDALLATFESFNDVADPATFVGLNLYPKNTEVDPESLAASGHHADLVKTIDVPAGTGGSTPTLAALTAAYRSVQRFVPPAASGLSVDGMKRVVVLLSDGKPSGVSGMNAEQVQQACVALAKENLDKAESTLTFSVGIGPFPGNTGYDPVFMSQLAEGGGTAPPDCEHDTDDPLRVCHFQVTPGEDATVTRQALLDAMNQIRKLTASCEFNLSREKYADIGDVQVTITDIRDGSRKKIPRDAANGWSFDNDQDPKKIILNGYSCEQTVNIVASRIDVILGCRGAN